MEGWVRILSPSSATWVAWMLVVLLILAWGNGLFVSDISTLVRGMFSKADRMYVNRNTQGIIHNIISWSYRCGIIALVGYLCIYDEYDFTIVNYVLVLGVTLGILLLRWLLVRGVGSVFVDQKQLVIALEQRSVVCNTVAILLWPIALLMMYTGSVTKMLLCGLMGGIFIVVMSVKYMQLFYKNLLSVVYMLLYVTSLEILPLSAALFLAKKLI